MPAREPCAQATPSDAPGPPFSTETEGERAAFRESAHDLLRRNDVGRFIKPNARQYPHQRNWDTAMVALGLSRVDLPRALGLELTG